MNDTTQMKMRVVLGKFGGFKCLECGMDLGYGYSALITHPAIIKTGLLRREARSTCEFAGRTFNAPFITVQEHHSQPLPGKERG